MSGTAEILPVLPVSPSHDDTDPDTALIADMVPDLHTPDHIRPYRQSLDMVPFIWQHRAQASMGLLPTADQ